MSDHSAILLANALSNIHSNLELLRSLGLLSHSDLSLIESKLPRPDALSTVPTGPSAVHSPGGSQINLHDSSPSPYPPPMYGQASNGYAQQQQRDSGFANGGGYGAGASRPPPPLPSRARLEVKAIWDYSGDAADDLSFRANDIIVVTEETNAEWWRGHLASDERRSGLFPSTYVQKVEHPHNEKAGYTAAPYESQQAMQPYAQPQQYQQPMQQWQPPPQQYQQQQQVAPVQQAGSPVVVQQQKPSKFGGMGKLLATSAVGGVGFGAGSAVGSGIINAIF